MHGIPEVQTCAHRRCFAPGRTGTSRRPQPPQPTMRVTSAPRTTAANQAASPRRSRSGGRTAPDHVRTRGTRARRPRIPRRRRSRSAERGARRSWASRVAPELTDTPARVRCPATHRVHPRERVRVVAAVNGHPTPNVGVVRLGELFRGCRRVFHVAGLDFRPLGHGQDPDVGRSGRGARVAPRGDLEREREREHQTHAEQTHGRAGAFRTCSGSG